MAIISRDSVSIAALFEGLNRVVSSSEHLALTTLPRGGLQMASSSVADDTLVRQYARGFDGEDRLTWNAISRRAPVCAADVWPREEGADTIYWRDLMSPNQLEHAVCFPVAGMLLSGYPGAIHLLRKASDGSFTASEIAEAQRVIHDFETRLASSRSPHRALDRARRYQSSVRTPLSSLLVLDSALNPVIVDGEWSAVDPRVREQMQEQVKRRIDQMDGQEIFSDRVQFPDSHGNVATFRVITHAHYAALGEGPMSFFCPQPNCTDWGHLRVEDFRADPEFARLIPALNFMNENFRSGPSLEEIAGAVHLSPFHFHRRFSELLGLTPKQFLLECQMHEAKTDLLGGHKELTEIARDCGFAHQSHFTSRFKQVTGLTPTRWRRVMEHQSTSKN